MTTDHYILLCYGQDLQELVTLILFYSQENIYLLLFFFIQENKCCVHTMIWYEPEQEDWF